MHSVHYKWVFSCVLHCTRSVVRHQRTGRYCILHQLCVLSSLAHHWQPYALTCSKDTPTYARTLRLFLNFLNLNLFMLLWHTSREDINSRWMEGRKRKPYVQVRALRENMKCEAQRGFAGMEFRNVDLLEFYWFLSRLIKIEINMPTPVTLAL